MWANVDTDAIIPSREMRTVSKSGLADGLFAGWRYTEIGGRIPNPDFVMNQPRYAGAQVLIGGPNFGCGSSREHAVWALREYGFRVVLAPSFSPIFKGNCVRNGVVPVELDEETLTLIAAYVSHDPAERQVTVDLDRQRVIWGEGQASFAIASEAKEMLLHGLDGIELTLRRRAQIDAFIEGDRSRRPWVYI
jgi:3-isopropylmalate/(R)-2-methylmalate dehydratase small subunit